MIRNREKAEIRLPFSQLTKIHIRPPTPEAEGAALPEGGPNHFQRGLMANRKPADPSARLAMLRPVLADLTPGQIVNGDEMQQIARMTWANLKIIIDRDPDFPVAKRGGMGIAWEFDAHAVIAHLIGDAEKVLAAKSQGAARLARLTGIAPEISPNGGDAAGMSALELKQATDAMMSIDKMRAVRKQYLPAADVSNLLSDVMSTLQAETLAFVGKHDPSGQLRPELRKAIEEHQRALLVQLRDKVMAVIDISGEKRAA